MLGNRTVAQVTPDTNVPIIIFGDLVGVTIDHKGIISDVPAYSMWVPNTDGKYVPLNIIGLVDSVAGAVYTLDSAAIAAQFDPTGTGINPYWLTANGGGQEVSFYNINATRTVVGVTDTTGEIALESEVVKEVDTADLETVSAFSTAPVGGDYILPGGIEGSSIHKQAIIIPRAVSVDEIRDRQNDWTATGYGQGTVLGYDRLSANVLALYTAGIIVADANIKIDLNK